MNGKNLFRGILWPLALAVACGALAVSFRTKHGTDYDVSPNVTSVIVETAILVLLTVIFWYLATNRNERAWLSKVYGFIASHGLITTLICVMTAFVIASVFFVLCPEVVSKDGYSSFMVPVPFIPACVFSVLAFAVPPVQVSHWSRKSELILTVLFWLIRIFLILIMAVSAAWMFWYSF